MAWIDNIEKELVIQTGDGKQWRPNYINKTKSYEYNYSEFTFPNVEGSLVKRNKIKGRRFPLEFYFQGDDCIETSDSFERSTLDERAWILSHPMYGDLLVQPISISFDNSSYNAIKVSVDCIETIAENNQKTKLDILEQVLKAKNDLDDASLNAMNTTGIQNRQSKIKDQINKLVNKSQSVLKIPSQVNKVGQLASVALSAINTITSAPLSAIRAVQTLINQPFIYYTSIKNRIAILEDEFNTLSQSVSTLTTSSDKSYYQMSASSDISNIAITSLSPMRVGFSTNRSDKSLFTDSGLTDEEMASIDLIDTSPDYSNANDVLEIIEKLLKLYNQFLTDLDTLQASNSFSKDSFIPDWNVIDNLQKIIGLTITNLLKIALEQRTERKYITDSDTNVIILTHYLYGLDELDENMSRIQFDNDLSFNELFDIKKGKVIKYYL